MAKLPSYKPLVVPPSDLRPPPGVKGENQDKAPDKTKTLPPEAQIVEIPFTDIEVPMPTTTIMTTAATTAFISVAATLTATSLFKYIVMVIKPVLKQTWSKLTRKKKKSPKTVSQKVKEHAEEDIEILGNLCSTWCCCLEWFYYHS